MSDIRNDDFDFQAATIKARNIDPLLKDYEEKVGSTTFSLKTLCSYVAKIIPFSNPNFIYHWSDIARRSILSDSAENRPMSSIGGTPPPSLIINEDSTVYVLRGSAFNPNAALLFPTPLYLLCQMYHFQTRHHRLSCHLSVQPPLPQGPVNLSLVHVTLVQPCPCFLVLLTTHLEKKPFLLCVLFLAVLRREFISQILCHLFPRVTVMRNPSNNPIIVKNKNFAKRNTHTLFR